MLYNLLQSSEALHKETSPNQELISWSSVIYTIKLLALWSREWLRGTWGCYSCICRNILSVSFPSHSVSLPILLSFINETSRMCVHATGERCHLRCGWNTSPAVMWQLERQILLNTFKIWLVMLILPARCNVQTIFSNTHYMFPIAKTH